MNAEQNVYVICITLTLFALLFVTFIILNPLVHLNLIQSRKQIYKTDTLL